MSCEICIHGCCVNGESGIIIKKCDICGYELDLCSNDLSSEQLKNRCNGDACGDTDEIICNDCRSM